VGHRSLSALFELQDALRHGDGDLIADLSEVR